MSDTGEDVWTPWSHTLPTTGTARRFRNQGRDGSFPSRPWLQGSLTLLEGIILRVFHAVRPKEPNQNL